MSHELSLMICKLSSWVFVRPGKRLKDAPGNHSDAHTQTSRWCKRKRDSSEQDTFFHCSVIQFSCWHAHCWSFWWLAWGSACFFPVFLLLTRQLWGQNVHFSLIYPTNRCWRDTLQSVLAMLRLIGLNNSDDTGRICTCVHRRIMTANPDETYTL